MLLYSVLCKFINIGIMTTMNLIPSGLLELTYSICMYQLNLTKLLWLITAHVMCVYTYNYIVYICIYTRLWCPCNFLFSVGGSSGDGDDVITVVTIGIVAVMVICAI